MPGDIRRVVLRDDRRNRTLLQEFFQQNRRRLRANELNRERREMEDMRRGEPIRRMDDNDDGKKHSSFNLNFSCKPFNLNFSCKPFA